MVLCLCLLIGCDESEIDVVQADPTLFAETQLHPAVLFCVSIQPLKVILDEIGGERTRVICLLPPGASPHYWAPHPSDLKNLDQCRALFYVDDNLDGWATSLPVEHQVPVLTELPENLLIRNSVEQTHNPRLAYQPQPSHDHNHPINPHFWSDPVAVIESAKLFMKHCIELDPGGRSIYRERGGDFIRRLQQFHMITSEKLKPYQGQSILQFHPSFDYLFKRYGLASAGSIETSPGKEPTPRQIRRLIGIIKSENVRGLIHEPQMALKPVETLAEIFGLKIYQLDPLISQPPDQTYEAWMNQNIETLFRLFEDS
jgi:zinc transport system substrate-binding protein